MRLIDQARDTLAQAAETSGIDLSAASCVLGVSGGVDSLALLHVLGQLLARDQLIVAHLDHGLRPESAAEAQSVAALANGLRFHSERQDVARFAHTRRQSLEEAARVMRYDFLARVARREGTSVIITGHQADDQVETILMHLLRGSGMAGLRGMRPAAPLPSHPDLWLWRPLLRVSRAAIDAYCTEQGLLPLHDASNSDPTFFRNRLRHDLLPTLETYSPQIRQRLADLADIVAGDEAILVDATSQAWNDISLDNDASHVALRLNEWRALPLGLRRRTLRRAMSVLRPGLRDVGFRALETARMVAEKGTTGGRAALPEGLALSVGYGHLIVATSEYNPAAGAPQLPSPAPLPLPVPGAVELSGGWSLIADIVAPVEFALITSNHDPWTAYLGPDTKYLIIRGRMAGERIHPLGLNGETKIKEVMIDRRIPAAARALWPIVATATHPVWLVGHLIDERARVRPGDARAIRLRCLPPGS